MSVTAYVRRRVVDLLEERRVVVWYDPDRAFESIARGFAAPGAVVVRATESTLQARREADRVLREMNDPRHEEVKGKNLLIYCPLGRRGPEEERYQDPFEVFARLGGAFGDKEAEQLQSLARQALPARIAEIDRLFREAKPTLALIEGLDAGAPYPIVRQVLGTESGVEAAAQILCRKGTLGKVGEVAGATEELLRLLSADFGYKPPARARAPESVFSPLGAYVLLSEFAFDLPGELPNALGALPRAPAAYRDRIFALCERMRGADDTRDGYCDLASRLEGELHLVELTRGIDQLGGRDTFPVEERAHLGRLQAVARAGDLSGARAILEERRRSVWCQLPERAVLWKLAQRCLDFLQAVEAWQSRAPGASASVQDHILAYTETEAGLWWIDRQQRLVEQGAAACAESEEIASLVALCRRRYREVAEPAQDRFLTAVVREGWPPEGVVRQSQTFDRQVGPALQQSHKVALFLVDAMRYEMGRDLASALEQLGSVKVEVATTVIPTTTPFGMAALMPGADGTLSCVEKGGDLIPVVAGRELPTSSDRMALLRDRYGDRFVDLTLGDVLSASTKRLAGSIGKADLVVVRTQEIDALGEGPSLYLARKLMTGIIGELVMATERLAGQGVRRFVYAADHGHVLLPEIPPGDVVPEPPGQWKKAKRRCRLGSSTAGAPGVIVVKASRLGIVGPVEDFVATTGFRVFSAGEGYFHEGLSLQECLVPVVVLEARGESRAAAGSQEVDIRYRADRFTSRVVGIKVWFNSLLNERLVIRFEAFDGTGLKARTVGEAADCDARDPATGLITLARGEETQVPIRIRDDFSGEFIEVRAIDPAGPGVILARLKLKNAMME